MKKIISLTLMLLVMLCVTSNVYAAISLQVDMVAAKEEYKKGEEFTVEVKTANLTSDKGIISFSARLGYEKNDLELVKMEGKNGWESPIEDTNSFNPETGKMAITRGGLGKNDETIFVITFKVKAEKINVKNITLKEITVADGTSLGKAFDTSVKVATTQNGGNNSGSTSSGNQTSGNGSQSNGSSNSQNTGTTNSTGTGNKGTNSSSKNDTVPDKKLPQTGNNTNIFLALGSVFSVVAVISFFKIKKQEKRIRNSIG